MWLWGSWLYLPKQKVLVSPIGIVRPIFSDIGQPRLETQNTTVGSKCNQVHTFNNLERMSPFNSLTIETLRQTRTSALRDEPGSEGGGANMWLNTREMLSNSVSSAIFPLRLWLAFEKFLSSSPDQFPRRRNRFEIVELFVVDGWTRQRFESTACGWATGSITVRRRRRWFNTCRRCLFWLWLLLFH